MAEYEQMLQKKHALLNRVEGTTTEVERQQLRRVSSHRHIAATLLPIRSVGVQVFEKSYHKKKKKKLKIVNKILFFLDTKHLQSVYRAIGEVTATW